MILILAGCDEVKDAVPDPGFEDEVAYRVVCLKNHQFGRNLLKACRQKPASVRTQYWAYNPQRTRPATSPAATSSDSATNPTIGPWTAVPSCLGSAQYQPGQCELRSTGERAKLAAQGFPGRLPHRRRAVIGETGQSRLDATTAPIHPDQRAGDRERHAPAQIFKTGFENLHLTSVLSGSHQPSNGTAALPGWLDH